MNAHTPGPWSWWTSNSFTRLSSDATGKDGGVAWASGGSRAGDIATIVVSNPADASLIAAAPDLLAALQAFVAPWNAHHSFLELSADECLALQANANAAIAKARGQS